MVGLSSGEASSVIAPYGERVSIAAVNAPRMIVIAGARGAIEAIVEGLSAKDVFCRPIKGAGAAPHSPEMDSIIEPLRQQLEGLTPQEGGVPFYSTVEGHCVSGSVLDAAYWGRNLRQPVRFAESIEAMAPHVDCFIEMSGHPVLAAAVDETLSQLSDRAFASTRVLPSLRRDTDEREVLLTTAGVLYTLGHELQWSAVCPGSGAVGPDVPLYEHLDFRRPSETATPPAPPTSMSLSPAQEALLALDKLQGALERERAQRHEPIAIVGLGCRFAGGANTPEQLWTLFEEGADCVSEISDARAGVLESWYDPAGSPGKTAVRSAAFLDFSTLSEFEPQFFDISPREAVSMDPQQRLLLEVAYEALERAGLANERLAATKTGVFVGLCGSDYWWDLARYPKAIDMFTLTGNFHSFSAGRISYALDLKGPAFAIDTACSSSLVAIHQAVQSLRARECDVALAGGANVISPFSMMFTSKMPAVAQDGRTKAFDAAADGTTRGEGCGMVALKRLADAEAAGDPVLAIIKGSAVNHDGRSNGLTAPSVHAQEQVIKDALNDANLSAADVDYVEAHGAGTSLGDPIEIEALKATYGAPLVNGRSCVVSAAKTNIGHTEAAAGVAALIKVVLSLQHQLIPGVRHLERLNPHIDLDNTRLVISKDPQAWLPLGQQARRAGVSAFGASGTNAHLIVEQAAPRTVETHADESPQILALSARTERALERRIQDLKALVRDSDLEFSDVCFSSNVGRAHHPHRVAAVAFSLGEALERLAAQEPISTPSTRRHVFRFSPVGESLAAMRADLSREPLGQAVLQRLESKWLKVRAGASRIDATPEAPVGNEQFVHFAASIAVAELWRGFGITPGLIVAEESTQLAAAVVAGILSESDAIEYLAKETDADRLTLHWERSAVDVQQGQWRAGTSDSVLWIGEPERNDAFDCVWASDGSRASILRAVAELYRSGASIDFREVHRARPQRMLALPTYPFDRRKYWAPVLERVSATDQDRHSLLLAQTNPAVEAYDLAVALARTGRVDDALAILPRVDPAALATRLLRQRGARAVQILDPRVPTRHWDLVIAPEHDGLEGANVIATAGSVWSCAARHAAYRVTRPSA